MYTYQDLKKVPQNEDARMHFVLTAIRAHKGTKEYQIADVANDYAQHKNRTIVQYQKILYTVSGKAVPDNWSANYKIRTSLFNYFITQQTQYLLSNGVSWQNPATAEKLGADFDTKLQRAGKKALVCSVSFGFYNLNHVEIFSMLEFVPFYDEENGALMSGIRFWQIDNTKPLRATLYEPDGYTEYIWEDGEGRVLQEKRKYIITAVYTDADGLLIYDGQNYPSFPIVPLWANENHQSELVGLREQIDAYDLIKSGFANDIDDASQIYWIIKNAGGMDDIDLAQFVQKIKTTRAAQLDDGQDVEQRTADIPYAAREALLDRLRKDMFRDYMALDVEDIARGAVTATQIRAAYEPMDSKANEFEYCILDFINGLLKLAGVEDTPTFTRSKIANKSEEVQNLLMAADHLTPEYVTKKVLELMGDGDKAEEMLKEMAANEIKSFLEAPEEEPDEGDGVVA